MATYKRLLKEYADHLNPNNARQDIQLDWDMHSLQLEAVILGSAGTPYEGGIFRFTVTLPEAYPFREPKIEMLTKMWHPNVLDERIPHAFCTGCLGRDWSPAITIEKLLIRFKAQMDNPDFNDIDCCNPEVRSMAINDVEAFKQKAKEWTELYARE